MSNTDFNLAASDQTDRILYSFTEKLKSHPHYFALSTPLGRLEVQSDNQAKETKINLGKKLKKNLESFPKAPEAADWKQQIEKLDREIENHVVNIKNILTTKAKEFLATLPFKDLNLQESDFSFNEENLYSVSFIATMPMEKAFALYRFLPVTKDYMNEYRVSLQSYNPAAFSENIKENIKAVADTFRELIVYLKSLNIEGNDFNKVIESALYGHIKEIENSSNYKELSKALKTAHRGDIKKIEEKPLNFHFLRALLAAKASWNDDKQAQVLFQKLDFFLQLPDKISHGVMSNCLEYDINTHLRNMFDQSTHVLDTAKLQYQIQLNLTDSEESAITQEVDAALGPEKEPKQKRLAELENLLATHRSDPTFKLSTQQWDQEYKTLDSEIGEFRISALKRVKVKALMDAKLIAFEKTITEFIRSENLDIDPEKDITYDPSNANYYSARELYLNATAHDIELIKTLPETEDLWIRRDHPIWEFIYSINGKKRDFPCSVNVPGATEYAPSSFEIRALSLQAPSNEPN